MREILFRGKRTDNHQWVILGKSEFWDFLQPNLKCCEVIGNIHDNPELLESKGANK